MKSEIKIVYKHYIPTEWIKEFETEELSVQSMKEDGDFDNFDGPELAAIIVYIGSTFVNPALYDIIKHGVVKLCKKLRKLDNEASEKSLSIRYEDALGRKLNINLTGNISNNLIEEVIEESLEFIKTDKKEGLYAQEDFVSNAGDNPTVELQYNQESKKCEPVNFGDIRRFWKKKEEELDKLY